jgi:hypothetical protein
MSCVTIRRSDKGPCGQRRTDFGVPLILYGAWGLKIFQIDPRFPISSFKAPRIPTGIANQWAFSLSTTANKPNIGVGFPVIIYRAPLQSRFPSQVTVSDSNQLFRWHRWHLYVSSRLRLVCKSKTQGSYRSTHARPSQRRGVTVGRSLLVA